MGTAAFDSEGSIPYVDIILQAITTLVVSVQRPKSTPILLVFLYIFMLVCQTIVIVDNSPIYGQHSAMRISEACLTVVSIVIILAMPMRNPELDSSDVCPPFKSPTNYLRSPEDNMTLWQFMTVTWMGPLISTGKRKQLNDEDVWLLPYEFQHSRLHHLFREIRGSVLVRLLRANALDLIITSLLGVLESVASMLLNLSICYYF